MYEKLIRDLIPQFARAEGRELPVRAARETELGPLLSRKLVEEALEVGDALALGERGALVDELGDLYTVLAAVADRHGIDLDEVQEAARRKHLARGGFDAGLVLDEDSPRPRRLHVGGGPSLVDALRHELQHCTAAGFAVAFVMRSGLDLMEGALRAALLRGANIRLLTTDYLDVTEPEALERVLDWSGRFEARVFSHPDRSFHPKAYWFERADGSGRAFIGSANFSRMGLKDGIEWTWSVLDVDPGHPMAEIRHRFDEIFHHPHAQPLSPGWLQAYRARRRPQTWTARQASPAVQPRPVQSLALQELERLRADGEKRALVIAATGLGKTFLAAFDAAGADRVLFLAHREELLQQAARAFAALYPGRSQGFVVAGSEEIDRDVVLGSVQTLSQERWLAQAEELARFDYVVVDEFHHAAADSYARLLAVLQPRFLLGLTATPWRGDNRDLMALCHGNVAYEVGLFEAIAYGWLVPFRYFGVADVVAYDSDLLTRSGTYDATRLTLAFNTPERAALALAKYREHPSRAALGFCVSIVHAEFMARSFEAAGVPAAAVHSGPDSMPRQEALERLADGRLRVLFTVDLFNEGVDIPCVDLVMFLRPTESMVVFLQQLGRGLRLHDGKDCLTVLDFLANYRRAHFKLPFLVGEQGEDTASAGAALRLLQQWQATSTAPASVPENVRIELEPLALAALKESLRTASPLRELVLADLQELAAKLGRMPTLVEVHRLGRYGPRQCMKALECRRWAEVAQRLDLATDAERALDAAAGDFLQEVERTAMTSSAASPAIQGGVKSAGMRQQPVQCGHSNSFSCNLRCIESADRSRKLHLMVIKAFRFQLRTKPGIERTLRRFAGSCRWVWNAAIAEQRRRRGVGEKFAGYAAMCRWLTEWRHAAGTAWLADTPIHPLQQTLRRLEAAYQRFFAAEGGHPRFKRRGQEPGLRFPDPKQFALDAGNARMKLPKLGWLRMRQSRPCPAYSRTPASPPSAASGSWRCKSSCPTCCRARTYGRRWVSIWAWHCSLPCRTAVRWSR